MPVPNQPPGIQRKRASPRRSGLEMERNGMDLPCRSQGNWVGEVVGDGAGWDVGVETGGELELECGCE